MTRQREAILSVLRSAGSHPDATWIYEQVRRRVPRVSLGTIYRNLRQMADEGLILELVSVDGSRRWDGCVQMHQHVICSRCGRIADVDPAVSLDELAEQVACSTGYSITRQHVWFEGICPDCAEQDGNKEA